VKITVPLSNTDELVPLIKEGADEFYFGLNLFADKINETNSLNLRPVEFANFNNIADAKKSVAISQSYNCPIYICFNKEFYLTYQYNIILRILKELVKVNLSGVIVTDIILIKLIRKMFSGLKIIASTRTNIFNSYSIKFYSKLGVDRFTLPRHLYFMDIINIVKNKKYEFEIFCRNEDCPYISGFCTYTHTIWDDLNTTRSFCRETERSNKKFNMGCDSVNYLVKNRLVLKDCGICSLACLADSNTGKRIYLKITGRMFNLDKKIRDVRFLKQALHIIYNRKNKINTQAEIKRLYKDIYLKDCSENCSYKF